MNLCASWAWSLLATLPVPMAHTGSYAITILSDKSFRSCNPFRVYNYFSNTSKVEPDSLSSKVSPMQSTTLNPSAKKESNFYPINSSDSPNNFLLSECPNRVQPIFKSLKCFKLVSPVNAPNWGECTCCAPTKIFLFLIC